MRRPGYQGKLAGNWQRDSTRRVTAEITSTRIAASPSGRRRSPGCLRCLAASLLGSKKAAWTDWRSNRNGRIDAIYADDIASGVDVIREGEQIAVESECGGDGVVDGDIADARSKIISDDLTGRCNAVIHRVWI